ncbi:MAG: hypothetical protein ABSA12_03470 [Verrucomicrobiia bacterium]|jgi:hypothetical protein
MDSWSTIAGFDVSWAKEKAFVAFKGGTNNFQVIDLRTGASTHGTFPIDQIGWFFLRIIDNQTKALLGAAWRYGVLDFDSGLKTIETPRDFRICWPPFWNEQEKSMVLMGGRGASCREELWVFNTNLDLIEKVDVPPLEKLWADNDRKGRKTDLKYAWVIEQRWKPLPRPPPVEFQLKTHTIEHRRIDPEVADVIR